MLTLPARSELRRRLPRLVAGLVCCGLGYGLMVLGHLGLGPWEVLHQGLSRHTGVPMGTVGIVVGSLVLVGWVPLRQRLGVGTVLNVLLIGITIDVVLAVAHRAASLPARWACLLVGLGLVGVGSGIYIGAGLEAGPRDGLMTGIAARGHSLRLVRTGLELSALVGGWLLGGNVGVGTVLFALAIGPLVQVFLGHLSISDVTEAR